MRNRGFLGLKVKYLSAARKPNRLKFMRYFKSGFWAIAVAVSLSLTRGLARNQFVYTPETPTTPPAFSAKSYPRCSHIDYRRCQSDIDIAAIGFGGMDFASVEHNDPGTNHRKGFQIGADFELPIFVWLWFQPELKYVQKGYSVSSSPLGATVNTTVPFNYSSYRFSEIQTGAGNSGAVRDYRSYLSSKKLSGGNNDIGDGESSGTNI